MLKFSLLAFTLCLTTSLAQDYDEYRPEQRSFNPANRYVQYEQEPKTTTTEAPVAILKQINRHNEDGSYTFGYEAADGSFKIETKAATGEVKGKYGYFDGERVRVVEYGANKHGFQPSGDGITVPPPTLHDDREPEQDEYEQQPPRQYAVAVKPKFNKQSSVPAPRPQQAYNYVPIIDGNAQQRKPVIILQNPQQQQQQPQHYQQFQQQQQQQQPLQYQYDYEQEEISTTARPASIPTRPKFAAPAFQFTSSPAPPPHHPPRTQFANAIPIDIIYADPRPVKPSMNTKSQYPALGDRRPPQFPSQDEQNAPPTPIARADEYTLFTPAAVDSRADIYKPKSLPPPQSAPQSPSPIPREAYQFVSQPRPAFASKPLQQRTTSILDQLAKDYALPQSSSAPLHDISFGYAV